MLKWRIRWKRFEPLKLYNFLFISIGGQEQGMVCGLLGLLSLFERWFNDRTLAYFNLDAAKTFGQWFLRL